jgi:iron complex transport system permease protein
VTTAPPVSQALADDARRRRRHRLHIVALVAIGVAAALASIALGAVNVAFGDVVRTLVHHLAGGDADATPFDPIIWQVRAPRVVMALIAGGSLALVGLTAQALVRTPLAAPYVLGVESGAAAAAVGVIYLGRIGVAQTPLGPAGAAYVGAVATLGLVFLLARQRGQISPTRLLLVGVALSYALSGLTSFVLFASPDPLAQQSVLFWILGGLGGAVWSQVPLAAGTLVATFAVVRYYGRALNALALGDSTARAVGLDPDRVRIRLMLVASLSVAVVVSLVGPIGFVGLVVPHVGRMMFGSDHRRLTTAVVLLGAIYVALVDLFCRTLLAPSEIPVGVMTAILGTPFFLWLIRHRDRTSELA